MPAHEKPAWWEINLPAPRMEGGVTEVYDHLARRETRLLLQTQSYRLALMEIVQVLGPEVLCKCTAPCEELRTEAAEALEIAQVALRTGIHRPAGEEP